MRNPQLNSLYISAKSLEATFDSLVLASAVDHIEETGEQHQIHADVANWKQSALGAGRHNATSHVVGEISALLGVEQAKVVVRKSLRLVGAMIANAEVGENGRYTDHGNLQLKVGELFVEHLRLYDNGKTYGAVVQAGIFDDGEIVPQYQSHRQSGAANATIGGGNVEVEVGDGAAAGGSKNGANNGLSDANRDVNNAHKMGEKKVIGPFKLPYTNVDHAKLQREVEARGGIFAGITKSFGDAFSQAGEALRNMFGGKKALDGGKNELNDVKNLGYDYGDGGEYDEYGDGGDDADIVEVDGMPWLNQTEAEQIIEEMQKYVDKSWDEGGYADENAKEAEKTAIKAAVQKAVAAKMARDSAGVAGEKSGGESGVKSGTESLEPKNLTPDQVAAATAEKIAQDVMKNGANPLKQSQAEASAAAVAVEAGLNLELLFSAGGVAIWRKGLQTFVTRIVPGAAVALAVYEIGSKIVETIRSNPGYYASILANGIDGDGDNPAAALMRKNLQKGGAVGPAKPQASTGSPMPDPDDDQRKTNPVKAESKVWRDLKHHKGKTKTNGLNGTKKRYYEWDHTHNDIEVYDSKGRHLGSADPKTGEIYKSPHSARSININ